MTPGPNINTCCIFSRGRPSRRFPRRERVVGALQDRRQLGEVPQQHRGHVVVVDPVDAGLGIDRGRIVAGVAAVALEPA